MKKGLFILLAALMMVGVSCSDNDEKDMETGDRVEIPDFVSVNCVDVKAPVKLVDKSEMPSWIVEKIAPLKISLSAQGPLYCILRLTWKGQKLYYIQNPLNSCILCDLYDETGENVEMESQDMVTDFMENSKDWTCIYIVGFAE